MYSLGLNPVLKHYFGEGAHAIEIAKSIDADYIGVECDESIIIDKLLKSYSKQDILGYEFLRMYKYYYKVLGKTLDDVLSSFDKHKSFDISFNPLEWFELTFCKRFVYGKFLEYSAPHSGNDAVITQRIGCDYSRIRDENSLKNLYEIINDYNSIVYVMGENHVYSDMNVLRDTFGVFRVVMNVV